MFFSKDIPPQKGSDEYGKVECAWSLVEPMTKEESSINTQWIGFLKIRFRKDSLGLAFLLRFLNANKRLHIYTKDPMCLLKTWYLKLGINVLFKNYGMSPPFWRRESVNLKYNQVQILVKASFCCALAMNLTKWWNRLTNQPAKFAIFFFSSFLSRPLFHFVLSALHGTPT